MCCKYLVFFIYFIQVVFSSSDIAGWNYINLHCRDNENKPVDWWYIYKPPVEVIPFRELGRDFIFITSDNAGRWQHSGRHITANSMLQHTIAPMFRLTYTDYLAVVTYEDNKVNRGKERMSFGILMADELGGVWIGHTVPGLIDITKDRPSFPQDELANGHLLMCLSLDLVPMNQLAKAIKESSPRFSSVHIPAHMRAHLPGWSILENVGYDKQFILGSAINKLDFVSKDATLRASLMVRKPGDKKCLYTNFAKNMNLVLDIYGHRDLKKPVCFKNYGARIIDQISMKSVEFVHYINRNQDRTSFAVSTAAFWQRTGRSGKDQYWTCTGALDDNSDGGGLLMCVENYDVWQTFDNFKVKEPNC